MDSIKRRMEAVYNEIIKLETIVVTESDDLDIDELASVVVELHSLLDRLKSVISYSETELLRDMNVDEPITANGRTLEKKISAGGVKWDKEALPSIVAERVVFAGMNPKTGAIETPPSQLIINAFKCAGIQYWKVGELKQLSIDPDKYRTTNGYNTNLIIRKGES